MATEFRLGYTGAEINQKLAKVDEIEIALENEYYTSTDIDTKIDEVNTSIEEVNTSIETGLQGKADLVDGKVPLEQLPDDIGSGGGLTEVSWEDIKNKPFYDNSTTVQSRFECTEGVTPVHFEVEEDGMTFWKVSDLVLTAEEIGQSKIIVYDMEYESSDCEISEISDCIMFSIGSESFCCFKQAGNIDLMGIPLDIPETGIYYVTDEVGEPLYSDFKFEISATKGELKTLDSKYIADMYYDTRVRSYFSQAENPNHLWTDVEVLDTRLHKISDLILTKDEIVNEAEVIINGNKYTFTENNIQIEADGFIVFDESETCYSFMVANKAGTLTLTDSDELISFDIPETGIYFSYYYGEDMPEGITIEFVGGGELKTIDPKFIPADLDFNLDDYYTKVESDGRYYTKSEVDAAINSIDLSGYYTKIEIDNLIGDVDVVLDEINTLIGE